MIYNLKYDFYKDYEISHNFNNIFKKRKQNILLNTNNQYKKCEDELKLLNEYFVEIFSWSALPKDLLFIINDVLEEFVGNYTMIDPCSGNSFHTFLFNEFCNKNVITIDIQTENDAWIDTIECDGLEYIKNNINDFNNMVLLLSWIDYDDLTTSLIQNFKGDFVLSVGNYKEENSKKYLNVLNKDYILIRHFILNMPWKLQENIKIFRRIK